MSVPEMQELDLWRLLEGIAYNIEMKPSPNRLLRKRGEIINNVTFRFRCKVALTPSMNKALLSQEYVWVLVL